MMCKSITSLHHRVADPVSGHTKGGGEGSTPSGVGNIVGVCRPRVTVAYGGLTRGDHFQPL